MSSSEEGIRLVVIGAGLCGLAAAAATKVANPSHQVTVLESARELAEVGVCRIIFVIHSIYRIISTLSIRLENKKQG
jgi:2-polyprenyl-6-methoxyphenol hydroxylase-like FAD-dependent oxidoreductase